MARRVELTFSATDFTPADPDTYTKNTVKALNSLYQSTRHLQVPVESDFATKEAYVMAIVDYNKVINSVKAAMNRCKVLLASLAQAQSRTLDSTPIRDIPDDVELDIAASQ
jgi:hypothetical protein